MPDLSAPDRAPATAGLRQALEGVLGRRIAAIHRRPTPYGSDFHTERIRLRLASGRLLTVFFKDFDLLRKPREAPLRAAQREMAVYRLLSAEGVAGVPTVYGTIWDDEGGSHWLFLEDLGHWRLEHRELHDWVRTVRWLARLHARFLRRDADVVRAVPHILRLDAPFFGAMAKRARRALRASEETRDRWAELRQRDAERLWPVLDFFPTATRHLLDGASTLVHGDCYSYNVLLRRPAEGRVAWRIGVVDWEMAGFGPGAIDVAALLVGAPREWHASLTHHYLDALRRAGGRAPKKSCFSLTLRCSGLYELVANLADLEEAPGSYARFRRHLRLPTHLRRAERLRREWSRRASCG